jgi:tetratricopeptide (TPR) repeat protein
MGFRILGSFEVRTDGAVLPLGGLRERTVLAVLVLDAGRMVPVTRLDVPGEDIDARVFEAQVHEAERAAMAGMPGQAAATLRSALALWRGPLLDGMPGPVLEAASAAWEERRRRAQDSYYEHMLGLGRYAEVIPELSAVLGEDRLREKTAAQLMLALYRCGRQGDALRVYRELSAALADRLGLDPGADLHRLHQQILTRDPALRIQEHPREAAGELKRSDEPRVAGRCREMAEIGRLLDGACRGAGGMLVVCGPAGSGKTLIAEAAAADARDRGFEVLWTRPAEGQPGRLAWARLLRGTGAPHSLAADLLGENAGPLDLDDAAAYLVFGPLRLIVVDDVDRGGPDAVGMLSVVAARCPTAPVAVLATIASPLGLRPELRLGGLSEEELAGALGELNPETSRALWLAARGQPGVARQLARGLADCADGTDPAVHLALTATATMPFLAVDTSLVRLLETAADRAPDDASRARVLARLAGELLGDATAAARRRALSDEALRLARLAGDPGALADVLDARLHALWDGQAGDAMRHFEEAVEFGERAGALPHLAHSLAALADVLADAGDARRAAACLGRSREIAQRLGLAVLLRKLGATACEWSLTRDGEDWLLAAGDEHARLRDARGLHYLRALLAAPGRGIRALDLAAGGAGLAPAPTGPALDRGARDAYRRRLGELTALLDGADRAGDTAAAARVEAERSALLRELRGAAGLGGRTKDVAPETERARVNVTRTLRTTIERIAVAAPAAAAHLRACAPRSAPARPAAMSPRRAGPTAGWCEPAWRSPGDVVVEVKEVVRVVGGFDLG